MDRKCLLCGGLSIKAQFLNGANTVCLCEAHIGTYHEMFTKRKVFTKNKQAKKLQSEST
jgi:hypothetical protein